jgi:hypothetical protein
LLLRDPDTIKQCKEVMQDVIKIFEDNNHDYSIFEKHIQSDIRRMVYIGAVLSQDAEIIQILYQYFKNYKDTGMSKIPGVVVEKIGNNVK